MDPSALKLAAAVGVAMIALIPIFNSVNEQNVDQVSVPEWLIPENPPDNLRPPDNFQPPDGTPPDWQPPPGWEPPPGWQPPPGYGGCPQFQVEKREGAAYRDELRGTGSGGLPGTSSGENPHVTDELRITIRPEDFAHRVWINLTEYRGASTFTLRDADNQRNFTFPESRGTDRGTPPSLFGGSRTPDARTSTEDHLVLPPETHGEWRLSLSLETPWWNQNNGAVEIEWEVATCVFQGGAR